MVGEFFFFFERRIKPSLYVGHWIIIFGGTCIISYVLVSLRHQNLGGEGGS